MSKFNDQIHRRTAGGWEPMTSLAASRVARDLAPTLEFRTEQIAQWMSRDLRKLLGRQDAIKVQGEPGTGQQIQIHVHPLPSPHRTSQDWSSNAPLATLKIEVPRLGADSPIQLSLAPRSGAAQFQVSVPMVPNPCREVALFGKGAVLGLCLASGRLDRPGCARILELPERSLSTVEGADRAVLAQVSRAFHTATAGAHYADEVLRATLGSGSSGATYAFHTRPSPTFGSFSEVTISRLLPGGASPAFVFGQVCGSRNDAEIFRLGLYIGTTSAVPS